MDIYPIWQTTCFTYSGNSVTYRILKGTSEIFRGKAVKSPADSVIRVEINKICATHINSLLGLETLNVALTADTVARTEAYCVFTVQTYNENSGLWNTAMEVAFFNDTSYEDNPDLALNDPINGHAAPGQFLPASIMVTGETGQSCYDIICGGSAPTGSGEYLTLEILSGGTIEWYSRGGKTYYSMDSGGTWTEFDSAVTVTAGDIVWLKGNATESRRKKEFSEAHEWETVRYNVYGNIMSLFYGDDFADKTTIPTNGTLLQAFCRTNVISAEDLVLPATTLTNGCYMQMFDHCYGLKKAPRVLPATTLTEDCYASMFTNCTALTEAPALPATTLANGCYAAMFDDCWSLETAPALPATTLAPGCYMGMFQNCTSLTTAPALPATALAESCYQLMFAQCTSLTAAPEMPTATLAKRCYSGMFQECHSLTTIPELPATTLADYCYEGMFNGCWSLATAPVLPATSLTEGCYSYMFQECHSLRAAPDLPATSLAAICYKQMFYGCPALIYVKCLAASILEGATTNWLIYTASTGTFVKAASATWPTGVSYIPYGWTVVNAS